MSLRFLIEKEFKQILRHSFLPKLIVIFPCMVMLVFPWVATMDIKNINISIVDNDHSSYSKHLTDKIQFSKYFNLTGFHSSYAEGLEDIESARADVMLEISSGFERDIIREGSGNIMITANSVNGTKGALSTMYLTSIAADLAQEIHSETASVTGAMPTINVITSNRFNILMDYKTFMIPALMVVILTMLCGFLPAMNIVSEKETGTIEQINVSPVSRFTFILSKLLPYWIIGFVTLSICFAIAALIYGLTPSGSIFTIYFFAALFMLTMSGLGLVISNYSSTIQQAMLTMFFFVMVFMLMSGLFTPIESMPDWAWIITTINPLKYFIKVLRMVYLKGAGTMQMLPELTALCSLAAAINVWAILSFRKNV